MKTISSIELKKENRILLDWLKCEVSGAGPGTRDGRALNDLLTKEAMKHYVAPQVYQSIRKMTPAAFPYGDLVGRFRGLYLRNAERNLRILHELSKVLRVLKDGSIPVLLLKGGHLASVVYPNSGWRVIGDIDLLFLKRDLSRAQRTLLKDGYNLCRHRLPLDIHWQIDTSFCHRPVDLEGCWERSETVCIGGISTKVLAPEDLLIHLCMHLVFHHRFQLGAIRTFLDIRQMIRHYGKRLEWGKVLQRAKEWESEKALYLTLFLAREFLDVVLPPEVLPSLKPAFLPPEVVDWAVEQIFLPRKVKDPLSTYFWKLHMRGPASEKLRLIWRLIFTPPEFVTQNYSAPYRSFRNYLYYSVRMKEKVFTYMKALWRISIREEEMAAFARTQQRNIRMMEWLSSG